MVGALPYKTPYFPKLPCIQFSQPPRQIVSDTYVVRIDPEVLEGDMNREE